MGTDLIAIALERLNNTVDDIKDTVSDIRVTQATLVESVKQLQQDKSRMENDIHEVETSITDIKDIPKNTFITFSKGILTALGATSAGWFMAKGVH